jgi:hypothetical protein
MGLQTGIPARDAGYQNVQYLTERVTFADSGVVKKIGTIPAGSLILKPLSGLQVQVAFNAGTNNFIDVGTTADDDLYGTDLSGLAVTFVPLDEAVRMDVTSDTTITATVGLTGTAATTGIADVVIAYIPKI